MKHFNQGAKPLQGVWGAQPPKMQGVQRTSTTRGVVNGEAWTTLLLSMTGRRQKVNLAQSIATPGAKTSSANLEPGPRHSLRSAQQRVRTGKAAASENSLAAVVIIIEAGIASNSFRS